MKIIRLLLMLSAFLIMISSALSLYGPVHSRTPIYVNVAAMACLVITVTLLNFQKKDKDGR